MAAATDSSYYVGQGNVLLASRISGGAQNSGFVNVGDLTGLQINFAQKFVDVIENQTGYGFNALHAPVEVDASIKLVMSKWNTANLEKALWGTTPTANPGGTATNESVTAYNGQRCYLAHLDVTALTLKAGATSLVLNTDYTVDGSTGGIDILPGSTVVPAGTPTVLTANYTYGPSNGSVGAFTGTPTEYFVRVDAKNVANPFADTNNSSFQAVAFSIYRVMFDITKMLDIIGKKDSALELDGKVLIDPTVTFTPGNPRSVLMNIEKR
ncbi:MAG: hypothetical protein KGL39_11025 [Patescibacteria group bacterium]|nr:hypothetical protein [Patescibacteria group bacterium]